MRIYLKLIIILLSLALIPIFFLGQIAFYNAKHMLQKEIFSKLNNVTDADVDQIESFFAERKSDLVILGHCDEVKQTLPKFDQFSSDRSNPVYLAAKKYLDAEISVYENEYRYVDIMLVNMEGKVVYAFNPAHDNELDKTLPDKDILFQKIKNGVYVGDIHKGAYKEHPYGLYMASSIYDDSGNTIGLIHAELDMGTVYKFMQDSPGLGETWETILVRRARDNKVRYLSPLKYEPKGILKKTISLGAKEGLPSQKAVLGESGSGISVNYRGKEVLSAWRPISSLGWGLVTEIDLQEAFSPIDKLGQILIAILIVGILSIIAAVLAVAKSISDPILKLHRGTEIIGEGNLDYKVGTDVQDEIGQLSRAFDIMTQNLKKSTISINELNYEIIQRQKIEKKLRELSVAVEQSPAITVITDKDGNIGYVNPKFTQVTGYEYQEVIGKNPKFLKSGDQSREFYQKLWDTITAGKEWRGEFHNKRKDGSFYWESAAISPIKDSEGNIVNFIAIKEDVSELKKILNNLQLADAEWQRTFDSISDLVFILDTNSVILKANKSCFEILKLKPEEMIGRKCYEVVHYLGHPWPNCPFQQTCMDEKIHIQEVDDPHLGITLLVTTSPIFNDKGEFVGAIHTAKDITQIKKYQHDLEDKNKELEKLDQLKSDFVSIVSHELRTPLSITKEGISLVLDGVVGEITPKQSKILTTSKDNIDRLARIINSLLDISRIESGRMKLENKNVDLRVLIAKIVASFADKVKEKGLELKINLPPDKTLNLYVDEDKLIQIFTNLISNSFKFTDQGSISVSLIEDAEEIEFSVTDTGVGIAKGDIPKLFSKFMQFGRTAGAGEKGTGLGLSIAKGLVELYGGRIWAESQAGRGSKFIFTIPKRISDRI